MDQQIKVEQSSEESSCRILVKLSYNGWRDVTVDRLTVAKSCFFLERLLYGPFKEARQSQIVIYLDSCFSFGAFEAALVYANNAYFDRGRKIRHYLELIQLASLWMYDELVEVVESHLMTFLSIDTLMDLHTLANLLGLPHLRNECIRVERIADQGVGSLESDWGRCSLPGHETHHYQNCPTMQSLPKEENWEEPEEPSIYDKSNKYRHLFTDGLCKDSK